MFLYSLLTCYCRYGSPGSVVKEYNKFAEWYLRSFAGMMLFVYWLAIDTLLVCLVAVLFLREDNGTPFLRSSCNMVTM